MRLYWGRLLKTTKYSPEWKDKPQSFYIKIVAKTDKDELRMFGDSSKDRDGRKAMPRVKTYEANTLPELYEQLKADGHQIRGYKDILDYAFRPQNAFEYILICDELRRRGNTDDEIAELFSLNGIK